MAQTATTNFFINLNTLQLMHSTVVTPMRHYNFAQSEDRVMSSRQAIFAFIVAVLLNFLQLKYQGKAESPFETHPKAIFLAITSLFAYCLSYDARTRITENHQDTTSTKYNLLILHATMFFFGPLSLASMTSVLFHESLAPLLFSLSVLFSLSQLLSSRIKTIIWDWLMNKAICIMDKFSDQSQQHARSCRGRGRVSVELPCLPRHGVSDQVDIIPV